MGYSGISSTQKQSKNFQRNWELASVFLFLKGLPFSSSLFQFAEFLKKNLFSPVTFAREQK